MSTSTKPQPPKTYEDLLKVSSYDRASSLLISLLVLVSLFVGIMFVVWITSQVFARPPAPELRLVEEEEGTQNPEGTARDIHEPGIEELDLTEPDVQDTLAAVTDAVSSVAASLDAVEGAMSTRGQGAGDNRKRGSGDHLSRAERWEINFLSTTLESYQKQLEFFQIELGAIGGGRPSVDYAYFERGAIKTKTGASADEKRLNFSWRGGKFKDQDRALLGRAGIPTTGRALFQFFSPQLENQLAVLEEDARGGRPLRDIRKTVFSVRPQGRGFEFFVNEIRWR